MLVKLINKGEFMIKTTVYDFKTNFSKYLEMVEKGEEQEIIVCRYNKKIATLRPYLNDQKPRVGCGKGIIKEQVFSLKEGFEDISLLFGY